MKNNAKTSSTDVQFTVKPFDGESLPSHVQHIIKRCDQARLSHTPRSRLEEKMRRALQAYNLSLNEFGAYQLKVTVPLTFKLKGISHSCYYTALKTDIPELAIERANQVKTATKSFFEEQGLILDELMTMNKVTFPHRTFALLHKLRRQFESQFINQKEEEFDFPEWGDLDLFDAEDFEAFPYRTIWTNMMKDKLNEGYPPLQFVKSNACIQHFFQFATSELHKAGHTSFPTISPSLIHQYLGTLTAIERREHRNALHFLFRNLNQSRHSKVHTRKVLNPSLSLNK